MIIIMVTCFYSSGEGNLTGGLCLLLDDWRAEAWCWTVCCTDNSLVLWNGWACPLLASGDDLRSIVPGLVLGQRGRTWPSSEALMEVLRYDWDDGLDRKLKMDYHGEWEGQSWLRLRVLVLERLWQRDPDERKFHWPGLVETYGQPSVRQWFKVKHTWTEKYRNKCKIDFFRYTQYFVPFHYRKKNPIWSQK